MSQSRQITLNPHLESTYAWHLLARPFRRRRTRHAAEGPGSDAPDNE
jgi:hypothetical protein